jgi:hypothetical protein
MYLYVCMHACCCVLAVCVQSRACHGYVYVCMYVCMYIYIYVCTHDKHVTEQAQGVMKEAETEM